MEENIKKFRTEQKVIPLVSVEPNPWNPNVQPDAIYKKLVQSIKEQGFIGSILVRTLPDGNYQILDGEHRYKACRELGKDSIKVEDMGIIDDDLAKQLTIMLKIGRASC